jgi:hypothetical protein
MTAKAMLGDGALALPRHRREPSDDVIGILLAKDLLRLHFAGEDVAVRDMLRPAIFIPDSKRLNVLLREFRASRNHMAIVVDEYGGVAGLVTIEDVLEQIVGDIEDEYDFDEAADNILLDQAGRYRVKAATEIADFNAAFGTDFSDEDFDTVGGHGDPPPRPPAPARRGAAPSAGCASRCCAPTAGACTPCWWIRRRICRGPLLLPTNDGTGDAATAGSLAACRRRGVCARCLLRPRFRPLRCLFRRMAGADFFPGRPVPALAPRRDRARSPAAGLAWGAGCFLLGVSWVYVSLSQFGGMAPPAAAAATLLFCLYLALFPALPALCSCAGAEVRRATSGSSPACGRSRNGCAARCSPASPGSPSAMRKARPARWPAGHRCSAYMASVSSSP